MMVEPLTPEELMEVAILLSALRWGVASSTLLLSSGKEDQKAYHIMQKKVSRITELSERLTQVAKGMA